MKELTKAEEQVMQYLWKLKKAFLKDIVDEFPEPKPAYTTISTVIRVLVKKVKRIKILFIILLLKVLLNLIIIAHIYCILCNIVSFF